VERQAQAGFEQLSLQLGKQLEQASYRVCALQGTMHASLGAATERLRSASCAETEQEARRVPELEESVRQLEASLSATEDELHAVRAAPQVA